MGVLQRIALAYGIGAFLCLGISKKHLWKVGTLLLLGYWALMWTFGGADPFSLEENLALKVDLFLLSAERDAGSIRFNFSFNELQDFVFTQSIDTYSLNIYALKTEIEITHSPVLLKISIEEGIITLVCPCDN